ncbi:hypothetical protein [Roseibium sp. RKSG952]|uniref:hypothetical protein n=1 Tax=Roseibium sp. RKSG952 TaxID=2529384 RepID=UPI0012BD64D4|nr:hypothetical protein [Roseibium sp. RKSG952]MTH95171.1 hypothetical protein [Roseibium sp. RKSG952]
MNGGIEALQARKAAGPAPVKKQTALRVAAPLFEAPLADRKNWTLARQAHEIALEEGYNNSRPQLSNARVC